MKVKQLKEILVDLPDEMEVVLSKDGEGNNFSPLAECEEGLYDPDSTWSGSFYSLDILGDDDYSQPGNEAKAAIVLWPTN